MGGGLVVPRTGVEITVSFANDLAQRWGLSKLDTLRRGSGQSGEHRNPLAAEARSTLVPDGQRGRERRLNRHREEQLPGRRQGYLGWAAVAGGGAGAVDSGLLMVLGKATAEG
jgi:hypothetical protein